MLLSTKHLSITGSSKLKPRFVGPFSVLAHVGPAAYRLQMNGRFKTVHPVFHVSLLRPHVEGGGARAPPAPVEREGEEEWEVERLLTHRGSTSRRRQFLVRWRGFDTSQDSWLNEDELEHAKEILEAYKRDKKLE